MKRKNKKVYAIPARPVCPGACGISFFRKA
jgi:hypothetical protein